MSELFHEFSLGWDYQNLGVLNTEMSLVMAENNINAPTCFSAALESDFSSGYLEDALLEFTSKRRRLLPHIDYEQNMDLNIDLQTNFWNCEPIWNQPAENFNGRSMNQMESNAREFSDEHVSMSRISEELNTIQSVTKGQEKTTFSTYESPNSSSSSYKIPITSSTTEENNLFCIDPTTASVGSSNEKRSRRRVITRVVYPFAMVKPGGIREGEVTLNDINKRILMPPTRPVRHPVGDFASRPCLSVTGAGLSGKAVVALTRIHTQGRRGTITIVRTKG